VAERVPWMASPRLPKSQKEEDVIPVRIARPNGSVARWMSCWVRVSNGSAILEVDGSVRMG